MQNALMAATIANNGIAMNPYVVSQILAPDGTVLKTTRGHSLGQAVGSGTAEQVKQAMLDVVQNGTGSAAAIAGVKVAGKTGTAETNNANANSTFVGFAPYDTPTVAIAVVIEQNAKGEESAGGRRRTGPARGARNTGAVAIHRYEVTLPPTADRLMRS